jgi:hypothetical protein
MEYVVQRISHMRGMQQVMVLIRFVHEVQHQAQQHSQLYEAQEHGNVLVVSEVQQ